MTDKRPAPRRGPMDPDRYQMKDIKRRITSLEKSRTRSSAQIDGLRKQVSVLNDSLKVLRAIVIHLEERIS